jgi:hypothetical protein
MPMRLITDLETPQTYFRDTRQMFYLWIVGAANDSPPDPLLGFDRSAIDSRSVISDSAQGEDAVFLYVRALMAGYRY